jgi:hypothetical protein
LVYNEDVISDNHEECLDILFENDLEHNKLEQRVVLDEVCYLNPQDQVFFQYPFVGLLESFKEGVCYAMNGLLKDLRKKLNTYVQRQLRWEWSFSFFSLLKKVNKNRSCSHLLDWLYWREEFT